MPIIRATRQEISDRFSVLGFNIRTDNRRWFEIVVATDPQLFRSPAARTHKNFFSTRASGPLLAERGEAVYLLPPEVLRRFVGQSRLYYGLATFSDANKAEPQVVRSPGEESPWVSLTAFTGRMPRRMLALRQSGPMRGATDEYGTGAADELRWAGDSAQPGLEARAPASNGNGADPVTGREGSPVQPAGASPSASASGAGFVYDDGLGPLPQPSAKPPARTLFVGGEPDPGIEEPIPDGEVSADAQGHARTLEQQPEYPQATAFIPARSFRRPSSPRAIETIVIHITDGASPRAENTARYFQNPTRWLRVDEEDGQPQLEQDATGACRRFRHGGRWKDCVGARTRQRGGHLEAIAVVPVSAHYAVGGDGGVVQMVRHADVAFHAGGANAASIGIEHCANQRNMRPTEDQYRSSAELVRWLAQQFDIPLDRDHILGHSEADPHTTHTACPNSVWDWDHYMQLVTSTGGTAQGLSRGARTLNNPAVSIASPIVGAVLTRIINNEGDIHWELDQLKGLKRPGDDPAQAGPTQYTTTTLSVPGPSIENLLTDQISADFEIRFQHNGQSLGNVDITNVGTNDAVGWGLNVKAQISDEANVYAGRAAVNIRVTYHFTRSLLSDVIGVYDFKLYGDGTFDQSFRWTQASTLGYGPRPLGAPAVVPIAAAIIGAVMTRIINNEGDIHWELDQLKGLKRPGDDPAQAGPSEYTTTTLSVPGPSIENLLTDQISADFEVRFQHNGQSLGNIDITNVGTNDAVGWGLNVKAIISDDANVYGGRAAVNVRVTYHFTRSLFSDVIGVYDFKLYGDGTFDQTFRWTQASTLGARSLNDSAPSKEHQGVALPPPPPPRARALTEGPATIGAAAIERVTGAEGAVSWDLDQLAGFKHPNDVATVANGFRDAPTIRLDEWPVAGGGNGVSAWFTLDWQYNSRSLGNVRIQKLGVSQAANWGLQVRAQILDEPTLYPPGECAALRVRFQYRFIDAGGASALATTELRLYADGTHERSSQWEKADGLVAA